MEAELTDGVDAFTRDQGDRPSRSEAIRRIVRDWLIGHGYLDSAKE